MYIDTVSLQAHPASIYICIQNSYNLAGLLVVSLSHTGSLSGLQAAALPHSSYSMHAANLPHSSQKSLTCLIMDSIINCNLASKCSWFMDYLVAS